MHCSRVVPQVDLRKLLASCVSLVLVIVALLIVVYMIILLEEAET
jgi:hypothetical protein